MPNSPLPVLLYRSALPSSADLAAEMERIFTANKWPPQWRNGVYSFHHYHSTAHEVLGFAAGHANLMLGGEGGETVTVHAGDVLVLPTGTGHCRISASDDFLVIGAYPENEHWDICSSAASPEILASMRKVLFPQSDPLTGPTRPASQALDLIRFSHSLRKQPLLTPHVAITRKQKTIVQPRRAIFPEFNPLRPQQISPPIVRSWNFAREHRFQLLHASL
jgi:uncharacterized protein YjlB